MPYDYHALGDFLRLSQASGEAALPSPQLDAIARLVKRILDAMPGGFFIYRATGNEEIIYANTALLHIFGCRTEAEFRQLTGNSFRGVVHPDDLNTVEQSIQEQIFSNQYHLDYVEYRITRLDGEVRWVEDYGHFIQEQSAGDFFYVFVADATEKRKLRLEAEAAIALANTQREQALQQTVEQYSRELDVISQEHLRQLEVIAGLSMDYTSIFYADLDSDTIRTYRLSKRIEHDFPALDQTRPFTGFADRYIQEYVVPEDRGLLAQGVDQDYIRERLSLEKAFSITYRIRQGNQAEEFLQFHVVNVGKQDHVSQIVLGSRSIDQEVRQSLQHQEMLEDALLQANAAIVAKNTFLANMSHDIRTPLNAIKGYTALSKRHSDDSQRIQKNLDMIQHASDHLLALVDEVLEISDLEAGKLYFEEQECSLPELVGAVQTALFPQAAALQLTFQVQMSGLRHATVYSDEKKLRRMLELLTSNAIHYNRPGGKVFLSVEELEHEHRAGYSRYRFVVSDTGIGISEEFQARLFQPFERERNTTMSGTFGTGLGLAVVKGIVDAMGGSIRVESEIDKGSCFFVTLPLRVHSEGAGLAGNNATPLPRADSRRILLVEDNELNREISVELLTDAGFSVDTAENGHIAVEKVKSSKPGEYSLILMDIQMPVMDGYQATQAIRALDDPQLASLPIIALSANALAEDKRRALSCGMNAHMGKPLEIDALVELIDAILKEKQSPSAPQ